MHTRVSPVCRTPTHVGHGYIEGFEVSMLHRWKFEREREKKEDQKASNFDIINLIMTFYLNNKGKKRKH